MRNISIIIFLVASCLTASAQKESNDVRAGNRLYKSDKFTEAEIEYRKGLQKNPTSFEANYNLGNALFKQKKYAEALEQFKNSIALQSKDKVKLAAALHNAGNSLLSEKKIEESISAFKSALKANPKDDETRYNLAYAQSLLKKQQENKDKDKEDKKDQEKKEDDQKKQDQQQQKPQMSKENAQQILDALMQDEKNTMEKAKKQAAKGKKSADKDW